MIAQFEGRGVEVAVLEDNQYLVIALEFTEEFSPPVVVEAQNVAVEPYHPSAERAFSLLLQGYLMDFGLCEDVPHRAAPLDRHRAEVLLEEEQALTGLRLEDDLDRLGLPVGIRAEIEDAGVGRTFCEVVVLIAADAGDGEAFDVVDALLPIPIDNIIYCTCVVALENVEVENVFPNEYLVGNAHEFVSPVAVEDNDVIDIRTVRHELILLQRGTDEAFSAVDIQLLVRLCHLRRLDGVEAANLRLAGVAGTVPLFQVQEPVDGIFYDVGKMLVDVGDLLSIGSYLLVALVGVEFQDACHLYLHQAEDVVAGNSPQEARLEGFEAKVDVSDCLVHVPCLLEFFVLIYPFFNKYLLQRGEEQGFG